MSGNRVCYSGMMRQCQCLVVLDLLVAKFAKSGGKSKAIEYDNFIECCLTVKGLTEKFKEDVAYSGSTTFTYESFMLTVLLFLIA